MQSMLNMVKRTYSSLFTVTLAFVSRFIIAKKKTLILTCSFCLHIYLLYRNNNNKYNKNFSPAFFLNVVTTVTIFMYSYLNTTNAQIFEWLNSVW